MTKFDMSDEVVIRVEGLGKKYAIGHQAERERYTALRDVMARGAKGLWRKAADMARGRAIVAGDTVEEFWALKNVSFEVKRGEVLGIIGRNGAGKSTLLKILSRITEPSEGRVTIKGRVASLLEVGTGFHPELTGRENIYLNGAILGMTRGEIRKKFDEIVAFAEVEKFLDTPVKRYSSGMYVRLAFAVAAHLEPEILVVDEVLAVGDLEFQKKCLGKMSEISGGGRTVLFVSHNLDAVLNLCGAALLLDGGRLRKGGEPLELCREYSNLRLSEREAGASTRGPLRRIALLNEHDQPSDGISEGQDLTVQLVLAPPEQRCLVSLIVRDSGRAILFELFDNSFNTESGELVTIYVKSEDIPLLPGTYSIDFWLGDRSGRRLVRVDEALEFSVWPAVDKGTSLPYTGALYYVSDWRLSLPSAGEERGVNTRTHHLDHHLTKANGLL
jgi:lipopolysaccharide transport system ATP-binding protein